MFNLYPYTDFHDINLDWIIRKMIELGQAFNNFEAINKITNAGAWDITKQYQAWTIVSDNNMGYISLKPVPVGVAITNTEYWGLVADYDILITDLSARISALENAMVSPLQGRRFVILTDSYGSISDNFISILLAHDTNLHNGDNFFSFAYPGGGFDPDGGDSYRWHNNFWVTGDYTQVTHPETITDFYIVGGSNDLKQTPSDVKTAADTLIGELQTVFTNAEFYLFECTYAKSMTAGPYFPLFNQTMNEIEQRNVKTHFVATSNSWFHFGGFLADNVHPTLGGSKLIAMGINRTMYGIDASNIAANAPQSCVQSWALTPYGSDYVKTMSTGRTNHVFIEAVQGFADNQTLYGNGSWQEICTLKQDVFLYGGINNIYTDTTVMKFKYSGNLYSFPVTIKLQDHKLYYRMRPNVGALPSMNGSFTASEIELDVFDIFKDAMYV